MASNSREEASPYVALHALALRPKHTNAQLRRARPGFSAASKPQQHAALVSVPNPEFGDVQDEDDESLVGADNRGPCTTGFLFDLQQQLKSRKHQSGSRSANVSTANFPSGNAISLRGDQLHALSLPRLGESWHLNRAASCSSLRQRSTATDLFSPQPTSQRTATDDFSIQDREVTLAMENISDFLDALTDPNNPTEMRNEFDTHQSLRRMATIAQSGEFTDSDAAVIRAALQGDYDDFALPSSPSDELPTESNLMWRGCEDKSLGVESAGHLHREPRIVPCAEASTPPSSHEKKPPVSPGPTAPSTSVTTLSIVEPSPARKPSPSPPRLVYHATNFQPRVESKPCCLVM